VVKPAPLTVDEAARVVKDPVEAEVAPTDVALMVPPPMVAEGVLTDENEPVLVEVDPIGPGAAKVAPPRVSALIVALQLNPEPPA
jgi:hypothetical protein